MIFTLLYFIFITHSINGSNQTLVINHILKHDTLEQIRHTLLGKLNFENHPDFEKIEGKYTTKENIYLRKEAYEAYKLMYQEAQKADIDLNILSASRNFDHQKRIWEKKWNNIIDIEKKHKHKDGLKAARQILKFSSMPGTSRHHWGTDIDVVSLEPEFFETIRGAEIFKWLTVNASKFGYCQPYQGKSSGRSGYEDEPWHWSYLPLASLYYSRYMEHIKYKDISGFRGSEYAKELDVIQQYVGGIWGECK